MENTSSNNYLTQSEASALAGVSGSTLLRFAEAGYFRIIEQDGQTRFPRHEICEVFGLNIAKLSTPAAKPDQAPPPTPASEAVTPITNQDLAEDSKDVEISNETPLAGQIEKYVDEKLVQPELKVATSDEAPKQDRSDSNFTEAFKRVLQLQEELLVQKESRIQELLKERDWLRDRLEKMEDKSDRDQMLLMVESQKVRTLIDHKGPAKNASILRTALGWFGGNKQAE